MTIPTKHPEAKCEGCGRENVVWFAPSDLWNAVARRADGTDPMLCPVCFVKKAEAVGHSKAAWRVQPEDYVTPNGGNHRPPVGGPVD